ncbi:hypothetical protein DFS33DRAFT_957012 [Desarmillaria ectypa]|nr:hypothetical protein DFS33DRAFT_957012 [Desarmillaria ectypa]
MRAALLRFTWTTKDTTRDRASTPEATSISRWDFFGAYTCDEEEVHRMSISIIHEPRIIPSSLKSCLDLFIIWTRTMFVTQYRLEEIFTTNEQGRTNPTASEPKNPQRPFLVSPSLKLDALGRNIGLRNRFRRRIGRKELGCVSRNMHTSGVDRPRSRSNNSLLSPFVRKIRKQMPKYPACRSTHCSASYVVKKCKGKSRSHSLIMMDDKRGSCTHIYDEVLQELLDAYDVRCGSAGLRFLVYKGMHDWAGITNRAGLNGLAGAFPGTALVFFQML